MAIKRFQKPSFGQSGVQIGAGEANIHHMSSSIQHDANLRPHVPTFHCESHIHKGRVYRMGLVESLDLGSAVRDQWAGGLDRGIPEAGRRQN